MATVSAGNGTAAIKAGEPRRENRRIGSKSATNVPILGYWAIRGLAQPIRLAFALAEAPLDEERYHQGGPPAYSRAAWYDVKASIHDLAFPNLPYYVEPDTGLKITQSKAILRRVGELHNLNGTTGVQRAQVDQLVDTLDDMLRPFTSACYSTKCFEGELDGVLKGDRMKQYLKWFENWLTTTAPKGGDAFLVSEDKPTVADCMLFDALDRLGKAADERGLTKANLLEGCPKLAAFHQRFAALPAIAAYISSVDYIDRPFNNQVARFK